MPTLKVTSLTSDCKISLVVLCRMLRATFEIRDVLTLKEVDLFYLMNMDFESPF
jgi:hypothetical protein